MNQLSQQKMTNDDSQPGCFSKQQLLEFTLGKLELEFSSKIAEHIDECETCEETIVGFDNAEDTLVGKLVNEKPESAHESNQGGFQASMTEDADNENPSQLGHLLEKIKRREFSKPSNAEVNRGNSNEIGPNAGQAFHQISDYRIVGTLGRGGMGTVFHATHNRLEKDVALKVLPERKMQNAESISRFRREMKIIGQLDHASIVQATDAGEDNGAHYLAMEFVDGFDLSRLAKWIPKIDDATCCELIRQAAVGIDYVHSQKVVHRDIKPSNLMLSKDGSVKILDLGLAMLSGMHGVVDDLTTVGQLMGTIDYMAPEQYGDSHHVDHRADIYAIGATLFRLLSGEAPFAGDRNESPLQKLKRIATEEIPSILTKRPDLDQKLAAIVDRCMARDKAERFNSAKEVAEALVPFADQSRLTELVTEAKLASEQTSHDDADSALLLSQNFQPEKTPDEPTELSELVSKVTKLQTSFDAGNRTRNRWWLKAGAAIAFLFAAVFCGIVIQIEMDKGNLVIESDAANVKVTLLKDGKVYNEMELVQGTNSTKIRAGKYEVVIDEASEKMVVDNNVFKLTRGETIVAKITRSPTKALASNSPESDDVGDRSGVPSKLSAGEAKQRLNQPVFQGLTLSQWLAKYRTDVLNPENAGSLSTIDATPISELVATGNPKSIKEAVDFWVSVIANETSMSQMYRLIPIFDALAGRPEFADRITDAFANKLMALEKKQIGEFLVVEYRDGRRNLPFGFLFKKWQPATLAKIENKLFDSKYDSAEVSNRIRGSYLGEFNFNTAESRFDATHQNILHVIQLSKAKSSDVKSQTAKLFQQLVYEPSKLAESTKSELTKRFEEMVRETDIDTKSVGITLLSQLAPESPGLVNEIANHLAIQPNLASSLGRLKNPKPAIDKIQQLLADENWGWDEAIKTAPSKPSTSSGGGGGAGGMGGMLGGGGGGGGMMGGSSNQSTKSSYPRQILIENLASLWKNGMPLLSVLRKQQEITANTEYLNSVWSSIYAISGEEPPELYRGRELSVWKKQLASPKSDAELAMAMLACGEMIGEYNYESRWNRSRSGRSSRSSVGYLGGFKSIENPRPENNGDYVDFLKSILPKIRHLDFENFSWDTQNKKELAYSDPRSAAYLLSQKFVLALIETADVKDFPFLITLDPAVDVSAYRSFQRAALEASELGSLQEARIAWDMYDKEFEDVLFQRFSNPKANLITRLVTLYRLFEWKTDRSKFESGFRNLIANYPAETLAVLQTKTRERRNRSSSSGEYSDLAAPLLSWLLTAKKLDSIGNPTQFKNSQSVFRGGNWLFDNEVTNSSALIARVLDCIELGDTNRYGFRERWQALASCFREDESLTTDAVKKKLESVLPKTDTVTATRIESMLQTLEKVDEQLEDWKKREWDLKAAEEKKKKLDAQKVVESMFGSDRNKDKVLDENELKRFSQAPIALAYILAADANKDGKVTEEELLNHAMENPYRKSSK